MLLEAFVKCDETCNLTFRRGCGLVRLEQFFPMGPQMVSIRFCLNWSETIATVGWDIDTAIADDVECNG